MVTGSWCPLGSHVVRMNYCILMILPRFAFLKFPRTPACDRRLAHRPGDSLDHVPV
jgi:hypothetical protein